MHQSVLDNWHTFSTPLEGRVHSMYVDVKQLVTCAVGNLIDPISLALQLPWKHERSGALATADEVRAAWNDIKQNAPTLCKMHWKYAAVRNDLRLSDEDIDALVHQKLHEFYAYLKKHHFPALDVYPADAQLGILSMSWACGPGFPQTFKNFKRAVLNGDWEGARASCKIREEGNPGVVPRNKHNRTCFSNAAIVVQSDLDRTRLYWPGVPTLESEPPPAPEPEHDPPPAQAHWIGEFGLPDDVHSDLAELKRKDISDK